MTVPHTIAMPGNHLPGSKSIYSSAIMDGIKYDTDLDGRNFFSTRLIVYIFQLESMPYSLYDPLCWTFKKTVGLSLV